MMGSEDPLGKVDEVLCDPRIVARADPVLWKMFGRSVSEG
jgi:hypothetical protein